MSAHKLLLIMLLLLPAGTLLAQVDSSSVIPRQLSSKYFSVTAKKIDKYSDRMKNSTEKTLSRLAKWENKIHKLLLKTSPETAARLFAPGQPTFRSLLEKFQKGKEIEQGYRAKYDNYRDELTVRLKFVNDRTGDLNTGSKKIEDLQSDLVNLDSVVANTEAVSKFIGERKKELIQQSLRLLGKNRYLTKLNKDAYYYSERLRNYKEIFSDPSKIEETAAMLLKKIPGFNSFSAQNSQLSGLFNTSGSFAAIPVGSSVPIVNGLPSRDALQQFMQGSVPTVNAANITQLLQGNISEAQSMIDKIKGYASGGNMNPDGLPDFKPNNQKSKIFRQRLEYNFDVQFGKSVAMLPSSIKVAVGGGYKFSDKNSAGIGVSYILGLGRGWDSLRLSHEGLGLRTYLKTKLKKGFALQGGSEWNYNFNTTKTDNQLSSTHWQQSILLGLSKSMSFGKKGKSNIQLYYDFLHSKHVPVSQPFIFRYGYSIGAR